MVAHNLNFHISVSHTAQWQLRKRKLSVIVENNSLKEQKNLHEAWLIEIKAL